MDMLEPSLFEKLLRDLAPLDEIYLSGGEPFEHASLATMTRASRQVAQSVVIYSSGVRMGARGNEPLPIDALREVRRAGVSRIDVSLYATRAHEHDAITRTEGSFTLTLETMRRLRAEGIPFGVHHVLLTSHSDVLPLARLAQDLGAIRLHVLSLAPQGRGISLGEVHLSEATRVELRRLLEEPSTLEIVLSSALRRSLGFTKPTARDALKPAMMDVRGFLYPSEGQRLPMLRSRSSLSERAFGDLVADLHTT
jgi:MoaA/NifB/PqqE/SkfB family radical SAM enzyme